MEKYQKVYLNRNLRKHILRGHPWVYKESVNLPRHLNTAQRVEVLGPKKDFLAWAYFDPHSPLALRVLGWKVWAHNYEAPFAF